MSAAKRKRHSASHPSGPARLISFLRGPGRPIVLIALLVALLAGGWCLVWPKVRGHALRSGEYVIGPQQVEITPPPKWIHSDVRSEVFHNTSLEGSLSILDDDLVERIGNAFSLHPWVARVQRVTKHYPARVKVELLYRRPVCMVRAPGGLFPVDARGVLLPSTDFSPNEAARYPRLVGIEMVPTGTLGESWGDARVVGGAEIADVLGRVWERLNLAQIVPSPPSAITPGEEPSYTLVTRGGTRIPWGRAPSSKAPDELSAAEKIARLENHVATHGTLEDRDAPQELDVRGLLAPRVSSRPKR